MRHVDHQGRTVLVTQVLQSDEVRRIGVHREQTFGHHHDAVLGVLRADRAELFAAFVDLEVTEHADVAGGRHRTFLQTGMRQVIHHDVVG
jgi:hypothetical protein